MSDIKQEENIATENTEICKEETLENKKPNGYFSDSEGNKSSGRLVKIGSWIVSIFVSIIGIGVGAYALYKGKISGSDFITLVIGTLTVFMGAATAGEIVQKVTGK